MKRNILILIFVFSTTLLFSQNIKSIYRFKKEKTKSRLFNKAKWDYRELDSLVLYENGTFNRYYRYNFHEISAIDYKGNWIIQNDSLILKTTQEKSDGNWIEKNEKCVFRIKKRKIVPTLTFGACFKKLKLLKK